MLQAFFCDDAADQDGKLHILGVYNELLAEGFPARQERLLLCGVIEWRETDSGRQDFTVDLLDPDGHSVYTVEGHTEVNAVSRGRPPARSHLLLPLKNVVFPSAGRYRTRFCIGGSDCFGPDIYLTDASSF
ncbi:MAG: hypothetical protein KJO54_08970 [Gammaproteobacteria bacterium]|nr:hypothetical protein [Gammaproteobacteria bacterium]NNF60984.1 hypothetical protein [Gammaproteobacteria bacterium]NNM21102.1 hypothetical protein [Gammaproteobacteria bacterium]